ncbi:hypothetical protein EVAR_44042_1 [Eumeta japonica]|uniref:SHSP domain-containing protein n=1 Tax=Eumeta variegata TaxID=151549 RepID=A0A4C1XL29_EUMVA|nr:hypothetical protein EVAR_44042_1 [Eumeta japonica]
MMYGLFVFALLGSTWAASTYRKPLQPGSFVVFRDLEQMHQELTGNLAQMSRDLAQANQELADNLSQMSYNLEQMNQDVKESSTRYFSGIHSQVKDGHYVITINLYGFDKSDIIVKIKDKRLTIEATHREMHNNLFYSHYTELPFYVSNKGSWTYDGRTLSIVFPVNESSTSVAPAAALNMKNSGSQTPTRKNSRPSVYATTHAVKV